MKMIFNTFAFLMLVSTTIVHATSFTFPQYEKMVLDNGLTVYLLEQHEVPLIDMSVVVKAGAAAEPQRPGVGYLTAQSLMLGTHKLSKSDIEEKLDFLGAQVSVSMNQDAAQMNASFAAKDQAVVMALVRDMLVQPSFDTNEFNKLKTRHQSILSQQKESPQSVITAYFSQLFYQQHPYGLPASGDEVSVAKVGLEDVQRFYQTHYVANNSAVVISGDFNSAAMKVRIQALFASWQNKEISQSVIAAVNEPKKAHVLLVNKADANETTILIGGQGIPKNAKDAVQLQVINTILGGRFTSWLNDELRVNSGLTYGAGSVFKSQKHAGVFYITTFTKTQTTIETIDLALKTYKKLWSAGIDEATLASAKSYVRGQLPPRYETSGDLVNFLTDMFVYDIDAGFINGFEQAMDELTLKRANELVVNYLPSENLQFVLIGQAEALREQVKKYGEVKEVEITQPGFAL